MLEGNNKLLIEKLQEEEAFKDRFSDLELMNMSGERQRGCFSLVFKAYDLVEEKHVAIKFYDLDPTKQIHYRLECFDREFEILKTLLNANRCLQIVYPLGVYLIKYKLEGKKDEIELAAKFFITEWLANDVDNFFLEKHAFNPLEKLHFFRELVLAVAALHRKDVFHRDLKADNIRANIDYSRVVAIDLGTAARAESKKLLDEYGQQVGAPAYAAPEALCGFAGDRSIAHFTDYYAMGCMLFELFNDELFYTAIRKLNHGLDYRYAAMISKIDSKQNLEKRLAVWDENAGSLFMGIAPVRASREGSSVPEGISDYIDEIIEKLTKPNFRNRDVNLSWVVSRLWTCIVCLKSAEAEKKRVQYARVKRERRREWARRKARQIEQIAHIEIRGRRGGTI